MGNLFTTLKDNWSVIADAPLAFALWTLALLGLCWWAVTYLKANQIGDLQSRIARRDDEIADYKRKLDGASPDEAKARIDALEDKVAALEPRRLGQAARETMLPFLAPHGDGINLASIIADGTAPEVGRLQRDFIDLFQRAGWRSGGGAMMGANLPPTRGGILVNLEAGQRTPSEESLLAALHAAGIEFEIGRQIPNAGAQRRIEVILTHDPARD